MLVQLEKPVVLEMLARYPEGLTVREIAFQLEKSDNETTIRSIQQCLERLRSTQGIYNELDTTR